MFVSWRLQNSSKFSKYPLCVANLLIFLFKNVKGLFSSVLGMKLGLFIYKLIIFFSNSISCNYNSIIISMNNCENIRRKVKKKEMKYHMRKWMNMTG